LAQRLSYAVIVALDESDLRSTGVITGGSAVALGLPDDFHPRKTPQKS